MYISRRSFLKFSRLYFSQGSGWGTPGPNHERHLGQMLLKPRGGRGSGSEVEGLPTRLGLTGCPLLSVTSFCLTSLHISQRYDSWPAFVGDASLVKSTGEGSFAGSHLLFSIFPIICLCLSQIPIG